MTAYNSNGSKRADPARLVVTGALQKDEGRLVKVLDEDGSEHSGGATALRYGCRERQGLPYFLR